MSDCERYEELISALLDGQLSEKEEAEVRAHMAECTQCRAMYEAFAAVGAALAAEDVPDTLHDGIMAKIHTAEKAKKTQGIIVRLRPILAAAACLVVLVGTVFALKNTVWTRNSLKDAAGAPEAALYSAGSASATASGAAPQQADEGLWLTDSKMAVAAAPKEAPAELEEEPDAARDAAVPESTAATNAASDGIASEMRFTMRVEALTENGLIGVVTDAGDQDLFAEGEAVTVFADGGEASVQKPGALVSVTIAADAQRTDGGVYALSISAAE